MKMLIVIDMQNDFLEGALRNEAGIKIIPGVVKKIKEYNAERWPIFATRDAHDENYLQTQEGQKLPVKHCIKFSNGWAINEDVQNAFGEIDVYCSHYDGSWQKDDTPLMYPYTLIFEKKTFGSIALAKYLKHNYSNLKDKVEIEIVGVCTDICVISNAMLIKAALPEAKIRVNSSLCAGVTEESHKIALEAMRACQIEII